MPESDPSDGEITDADEFLREIGNIERDETLIDFVGQGYDVNTPGDQDVADLLGAWRDDVGRAPVNVEPPGCARSSCRSARSSRHSRCSTRPWNRP